MALGSEGTVRGAFDLDTRPAQRAVRDYRREAARADAQTRQLGSSMDDAFGRQGGSIREMREEMADLRTEMHAVESDLIPVMHKKTAAVKSQRHEVRLLRLEVQRLGYARGNAQVQVDGIARALAQVELLHSRVNALGRENATARVGVSGGFGSAAQRAAAGAASGGGGGGFASLGGIGMGGIRGGALMAGLVGLGLPAVQGLAGGAGAVVGSAGAGLLGGGAVGLAGGAGLAVGAASIMSVAKPAQEAIKEAIKLEEEYRDVVIEHGRASKEAAASRKEMNHALRAAPGARALMHERAGFGRDWRRQTRAGRRDWAGMQTDVIRTGRRVSPLLAENANMATGALRGAAGNLAESMARPEMMGHLSFFTRSFARDLPIAERSLENSVTAMARLARAAMPFFHEANEWVEDWTGGWSDSVKNVSETRSQIGDLVDSGKEWAQLLDASWDLLKTISSAGKPSGDSLVGSLTETFRTWDATMKANPARTRRFFDDAANSTRQMATAMADFAGFLHEVADLLRPTFDRVMQLLSVMSNLGLAGPGVMAMMLGGYRGARGRGAPMMGAGAPGGGATMMPMPMGTGGLGGTGRYGMRSAYGTYQMQRQAFGATRGQAAGTAARGMMGRGAMPMLGGALRGAGRALWPIAAGMGLLDFASFEGNVGERAQAAASGATLGLIPRPMSGDERKDRAAATTTSWASENLAGLAPDRRGTLTGLVKTRAEIARLRAINAGGAETGYKARIGGMFGSDRLTEDDISENEERIRLLTEEKNALRETNREMEKQADARRRERQRQAGTIYGGQLPGAFREYRRAGMGPEDAARATAKQAGGKIASIGEGGVEALGESSLAWARTVAKNSPALKGVVDDLADDIEQRYRRMGRRVNIVNGDILLGTKREWGQIRDALAGASEVAKQKVSEDFTAIQQKAIGSLRSMGFDGGQAQQLVSALEGGGGPAHVARMNIGVQQAGGRTMIDPLPKGTGGKNRARGGVIAGQGLADTVPMGDGLVAPGEAWIANRHTMRDLSRATLATSGFTAEQIIKGEHRRHSAKYGFGGRFEKGQRAAGAMSGGGPGPWQPGLSTTQYTDALIRAFSPGLSRGSGYRSPAENAAVGGSPTSDHMKGTPANPGAWDVPVSAYGPQAPLGDALAGAGRRFGVPQVLWRVADHFDHVHLGYGASGGAQGVAGGGGAVAMGLGKIKLSGVGRRQPGVPGLLRQRAGDLHAGALEKRINETLGKMGGGAGGMMGGAGLAGGGAGSNMKAGHKLMLRYWGEDQWPALRELWMRESGWRNVMNTAGSGATGIPQALPGSKMASHGSDWATNPVTQIRWGLDYIKGRYGSPSQALAFHDSNNWYSRGGRMQWGGAFERGGSFVTDGPTQFVAGEGSRRRERVTVSPVGATSTRAGGGVSIGELNVKVIIEGGIKSEADIEAVAERVGKKVVKKIIDSIDRGETAGVVGG